VTSILGHRVAESSALYAFAIALVVSGLVAVPLALRLALRLGVVDRPGGRRIHDHPVPLLGGLGILAGIAVAALLTLDVTNREYGAILLGALGICALGAIDDARGLRPATKFAGQALCAVPPLVAGVTIDHFTLPFVDPASLGVAQYPVTLVFIVAVANIVNFADGMDGLAAGLCCICAATFAILAISLDRFVPATLAAAVAGACLGFLRFNFHPAKIFMGDSGSLPLGYLLATLSISGVMKTAAALALVFPLLVLLVPIADTSFVILKRLKYGRSILAADANHLHHRALRIGYSQRRAALLLYAWCAIVSSFALAVRFLRVHPHGHWNPTNLAWISAYALVVVAASLYVVYALEILKYRHLRMVGLARRSAVDGDVPLVVERRRRRGVEPAGNVEKAS
jgi:UDP-GlcNAc:undecaprenyl-phosphate GlcNAc-1-phosphate transferase